MKKSYLILVIFSLFVFAACGGSKSENKEETPDSADTVTDDDGNAADTDSSDTEPTEKPDSDNGDTTPEQPDNGDTTPEQPDNGDSQPDNGDTTDDSDTAAEENDDDADTAPAIPECSGEASTFPCKDAVTGYIWSSKSNGNIKGQNAAEYCENSTEGGLSWKLPTIDELRTLIKGCDNTKTGGDCAISEKDGKLSQDFWSSKCYCSDDSFDEGIYSIFGDTENWFWSSSFRTEDSSMWGVDFHQARVTAEDPATKAYVRCVVNDEEDSGDTQPDADTDSGDSKPDADADTDSGDSQPDEDADTDSGDTRLDCTSFPCIDSSTGYLWSEKMEGSTTWEQAKLGCSNLNSSNYGGFNSGWHLPNIDELKTLLTSASGGTPRSANCQVSEANNCLDVESCWTCATCTEQGIQESDSIYCSNVNTECNDFSKLSDNDWFWSSSLRSDDSDYPWRVNFCWGQVRYDMHKNSLGSVRCVRNAE